MLWVKSHVVMFILLSSSYIEHNKFYFNYATIRYRL